MDPTMEPDEDFGSTKFKIDYVGYVIVPSVLIVGLFGNCMTLTVMGHKKFLKMPMSLLLRALSLSDTTLIVLLPFNKQFIMTMIGMDIRALSTPTCKLFFWVWKTSKMTSSWLVLLLTLERLIAVLLPMRANQLITRGNVAISIVLVYFGIGGYNCAWESIVTRVKGERCLANFLTPGYEVAARVVLITSSFIYCYIPGVLILLFNCLITRQLIIKATERKQLTKLEINNDVTIRTTIMLLAVSFAFVVLIVPISTMHIMSMINRINIFETNYLPMVVFREVAQVMELIHYSSSFYFYVVCCKKFRKYALRIMCPCRYSAGISEEKYLKSGTSLSSVTKDIEIELK